MARARARSETDQKNEMRRADAGPQPAKRTRFKHKSPAARPRTVRAVMAGSNSVSRSLMVLVPSMDTTARASSALSVRSSSP